MIMDEGSQALAGPKVTNQSLFPTSVLSSFMRQFNLWRLATPGCRLVGRFCLYLRVVLLFFARFPLGSAECEVTSK